ncbi:hypothetical protein PRNP1_014521 [Phytophthora ramorum]
MRNFEDRERRGIIAELLKRSTNGELERGALAELAEELGRNRSTISRIWTKYTEAVAEGNEDESWRSGKKQRCGRKKVDRQELQALVAAVPIEDRQVQRQTAHHAGISRYLVRAMLREEELNLSAALDVLREAGRRSVLLFDFDLE